MQVHPGLTPLEPRLFFALEAKLDEALTLRPYNLVCPISHALMTDPVVAADGHSYERREIERWISSGTTAHARQSQAYTVRHVVLRRVRPRLDLTRHLQPHHPKFLSLSSLESECHPMTWQTSPARPNWYHATWRALSANPNGFLFV